MREHDIVELILVTAKNQANIADVRDDEILDVLVTVDETFTVTDSVPVLTLNDAIIKWGLGGNNTKYNLGTWGDLP